MITIIYIIIQLTSSKLQKYLQPKIFIYLQPYDLLLIIKTKENVLFFNIYSVYEYRSLFTKYMPI